MKIKGFKWINTGILSDLVKTRDFGKLESQQAYYAGVPNDPVKLAETLLAESRRYVELASKRPVKGEHLDRESRHAMQKELAQLERKVRDFKDWYAEALGDDNDSDWRKLAVKSATLWAMEIMRLAVHIQVRPSEPMAVVANKVSRQGTKNARKTNAERAKNLPVRDTKIRARVQYLHELEWQMKAIETDIQDRFGIGRSRLYTILAPAKEK